MRSLMVILLLIVSCLSLALSDKSSEAFSFYRSLARMCTYITTESVVYHMDMDKYHDGNILFSDNHALKSTDGNITQTVAGQATDFGYREGVGEAARFVYISGFHQNNSTKVVVVDQGNHCLRLINRLIGQTQTFAGTCTKSGYADGSQALFSYPWSIIPDNKNQDKLLVTDRNNKAVRSVDINTAIVSTFFRSEALNDPRGITQDVPTGHLYLTTSTAVYKLNYQTKELTIIAGSPTKLGYRDGDFSVSQFNNPRELLLIEKGRKLLIADDDNNRLRVLDMKTNITDSLCTGTAGRIDGDMDNCTLYDALSLMALGDSLYIGEQQRIRKLSGQTYTTPTTTPRLTITMMSKTGTATSSTMSPPSATTDLPVTSSCTDQNITVYTDTHTDTARVQLADGVTYTDLPAGTHTYDTLTAQNLTCITTFHVINNRTGSIVTATPTTTPTTILTTKPTTTLTTTPTATSTTTPTTSLTTTPTTTCLTTANSPCTCGNITKQLQPGEKTVDVETVPGHSLQLPAGEYKHKLTSQRGNCTIHISITKDISPQTLTCPETIVALTSPKTGLATFQLKFDRGQHHDILLPLGRHPYIIHSSEQICNVTLDARDYRVQHTLEFEAYYSVDCSVLNLEVARGMLEDVAKQSYSIIDILYDSVCKSQGYDARPVMSCDRVNGLRIRWPTDMVFAADVVNVPANIRRVLETSIKLRGLTLGVVVLGASPPIVYPTKAANGGYVSIALSTSCINGLIYSDTEDKCV